MSLIKLLVTSRCLFCVMFSKTCEYALKIMMYLAVHQPENRLVGLKEIAQAIDSPVAFTAKITPTTGEE